MDLCQKHQEEFDIPNEVRLCRYKRLYFDFRKKTMVCDKKKESGIPGEEAPFPKIQRYATSGTNPYPRIRISVPPVTGVASGINKNISGSTTKRNETLLKHNTVLFLYLRCK